MTRTITVSPREWLNRTSVPTTGRWVANEVWLDDPYGRWVANEDMEDFWAVPEPTEVAVLPLLAFRDLALLAVGLFLGAVLGRWGR